MIAVWIRGVPWHIAECNTIAYTCTFNWEKDLFTFNTQHCFRGRILDILVWSVKLKANNGFLKFFVRGVPQRKWQLVSNSTVSPRSPQTTEYLNLKVQNIELVFHRRYSLELWLNDFLFSPAVNKVSNLVARECKIKKEIKNTLNTKMRC